MDPPGTRRPEENNHKYRNCFIERHLFSRLDKTLSQRKQYSGLSLLIDLRVILVRLFGILISRYQSNLRVLLKRIMLWQTLIHLSFHLSFLKGVGYFRNIRFKVIHDYSSLYWSALFFFLLQLMLVLCIEGVCRHECMNENH